MRWRVVPEPLDQWHRKFLWRPEIVDGYLVWLETVERRILPLVEGALEVVEFRFPAVMEELPCF